MNCPLQREPTCPVLFSYKSPPQLECLDIRRGHRLDRRVLNLWAGAFSSLRCRPSRPPRSHDPACADRLGSRAAHEIVGSNWGDLSFRQDGLDSRKTMCSIVDNLQSTINIYPVFGVGGSPAPIASLDERPCLLTRSNLSLPCPLIGASPSILRPGFVWQFSRVTLDLGNDCARRRSPRRWASAAALSERR